MKQCNLSPPKDSERPLPVIGQIACVKSAPFRGLIFTTKELLRKNGKLIAGCFVILLLGVSLGFFLFPKFEDRIESIVEQMFAGIIVKENRFQTAINIMVRNITVSAIVILTGIVFFIPPTIVFINGFVAGLVVKFSMSRGIALSTVICGVLPHSILEIPAFMIAAAFGAKIGFSMLFPKQKSRKKAFTESLKEAAYVYFLIVLPLMILAAFVESYVSTSMVL